VEVVHVDDSIEISLAAMPRTQKIKSRSQGSVWKAVIMLRLQKIV
jgi:hypothetical protein